MKILMMWLCASSAMDDCQVQKLGPPEPQANCEKRLQMSQKLLGTGPDQNYRFKCDDA